MSAELIDIMLAASIDAARIIDEVYKRPIVSSEKSDGSPVTEADQRAEAIILDHLMHTGIPVLAEESVAAGYVPHVGDRFFVVDPLDGTKEFLKRNGEFTVNIALVEHGRPVLGVVLAPATGEAFSGSPEGAFSYRTASGRPLDRTPLGVDRNGRMLVVASRSHGHDALADLCAAMEVEADVSVGSSLKFCLLARGEARLYPRFTPTCEWDTAAGQAVLEAAGGVVLAIDGSPLRYGKTSRGFLNPFFVAASDFELASAAAERMRILCDVEISR